MGIQVQQVGNIAATASFCALAYYVGGAAATAAAIGDPSRAAFVATSASLIGNVAAGWAAGIAENSWARCCERLFGGRDSARRVPAITATLDPSPLDADILDVLCRAFRGAIKDLQERWRETQGGHKDSPYRDSAEAVFADLRAIAAGDGAPSMLRKAIDQLGVTKLLDRRVSEREAMAADVRAALGTAPGDDVPGLVDFLAEYLPSALAVRFGEELKQDTTTSNRAWRRGTGGDCPTPGCLGKPALTAVVANPAALRDDPAQQSIELAFRGEVERTRREFLIAIEASERRTLAAVEHTGDQILRSVDGKGEEVLRRLDAIQTLALHAK